MSVDPRRIARGLDRLRRALLFPGGGGGPVGSAELEPALAGAGGGTDQSRPALVCVFCGARRHVIPHRGKGICVDCVGEIRRIVSAEDD